MRQSDSKNSHKLVADAADYAKHFDGLQAFFVHYRPVISPFEPIIEAVPIGARVLDIGAGNGLLLFLLRKNGWLGTGVGIDIAEHEIATGTKALAALDVKNVQLRVLDDLSQLEPESFDVVTVIDVMHHVPPLKQAEFFKNALQRVAPGGLLIYKDMCKRPHWRAWANRLHDLVKAKQWIHYRAVTDIEDWAKAQGFELSYRQDMARYWYGHELRIFQRGHSSGADSHQTG
jgi:2-polyprenyl-3-methyl-5-hydroxy-6-metoxy-1,4-benzoquinol methylase